MSNRFLDQHNLRPNDIHHHDRVHSAPDVPFSWEMSPGVSKLQHDQNSSSSRRHGREKLRDLLQDHHQQSSGTYLDDQQLSPRYLDHESNRRAIQKPPLRPPPCLITSSPRVSSLHGEHPAARCGTHKTASKMGGRKGGGGVDADPFLAAYVKCTTPQNLSAKRKSSGFSFSCKSSVAGGIRDDALVRIPRPSKI